MEKFFKDYLNKLTNLIDGINPANIKNICNLIDLSCSNYGKIYVIGNGGSAATASHMANDLGIGLNRRNIRNFNIISLADNTPVITAIANDIGYENIFLSQIENKLNVNDIIIAISCSGNSRNIIKAVKYAKQHGCKIIGLTGFDGGELLKMVDYSFHIPTKNGEYGLVEDMHMIFDHMIYSYFISLETKKI